VTMSRVFVSALVCGAAACAAQTGQTPDVTSSQPAAATRTSRDVISEAELSDPSLGDLDAASIIRRLRPAFLQTRGSASANTPGGDIHVTIDNGPFLTTDALTTIRAHEMIEIRYYSASAAAQAYGSKAASGPVIFIRRR
jgi:hypothetical protein